ncbi:MAG: SLC13/DASS family transporter, partial [Candidatus Hydrothermota bacterium]
MNPRKLNQLIFITLLAAISYKLPLFLDLTKGQRINLVIFLVAALLWITEVVPLFVTALIILFLEAVWLKPNAPGTSLSTYLSPFFSSVILLFLGGFVLAKALETYKLDEIFAKKILQRTGTKPSSVLFGFMLVTAFLSMWMSNTAITALMIAVALPPVRKIDDKNFTKALLIGIAFSANIGGMGTPIGTPPNAIA